MTNLPLTFLLLWVLLLFPAIRIVSFPVSFFSRKPSVFLICYIFLFDS